MYVIRLFSGCSWVIGLTWVDITRVGTMGLFSWRTSESHFKWSVGSSRSQKMTFCKIWPPPASATRENVNFRFLIKKRLKIDLFLLVNSFWMSDFWYIYVFRGGKNDGRLYFHYSYHFTSLDPIFGDSWSVFYHFFQNY